MKGCGVGLNKHLKKKECGDWQACVLKKENKIQATRTRNCKGMIKLNGEEDAKVLLIRELEELDKYRRCHGLL